VITLVSRVFPFSLSIYLASVPKYVYVIFASIMLIEAFLERDTRAALSSSPSLIKSILFNCINSFTKIDNYTCIFISHSSKIITHIAKNCIGILNSLPWIYKSLHIYRLCLLMFTILYASFYPCCLLSIKQGQ